MKSRVLLLAVFLAAATAPVSLSWAWGDWSVWQTAKQKAYQIEGRITAILINEDEHKILVNLAPDQSPTEVQTVRVCNQDVGSDARSFEQAEKMALLRQAFSRGDKIKVSYGGPFDRCLSQIQYSAREEKGVLPPGSI